MKHNYFRLMFFDNFLQTTYAEFIQLWLIFPAQQMCVFVIQFFNTWRTYRNKSWTSITIWFIGPDFWNIVCNFFVSTCYRPVYNAETIAFFSSIVDESRNFQFFSSPVPVWELSINFNFFIMINAVYIRMAACKHCGVCYICHCRVH